MIYTSNYGKVRQSKDRKHYVLVIIFILIFYCNTFHVYTHSKITPPDFVFPPVLMPNHDDGESFLVVCLILSIYNKNSLTNTVQLSLLSCFCPVCFHCERNNPISSANFLFTSTDLLIFYWIIECICAWASRINFLF